MRVIILGCGPAGLLAAHSAVTNGHDVVIFSKMRKSEMFGCQYLHTDIPGLELGAPVEVLYETRGTSEQYRRKVYGDKAVQVSPDTLEEDHHAWDIRLAYDRLWARYWRNVTDLQVTGETLRSLGYGSSTKDTDVIISTIPAKALCLKPNEHWFKSEFVWAIGDAPERGIFAPRVEVEPDTVVCNGRPEPRWYRAADVFGYRSVEWPDGPKPPIEGVTRIEKPLETNCDCLPHIHRLGRFGKWKKGVLSSDAFADAEKIFSEEGRLF